MNYYFDTEFIDHAKQPRFCGIRVGKPIQTTELISIGIVAEDGREYYAVSNEFDLDAAWRNKWVRLNVLLPLHAELCDKQGTHAKTYHYGLFEPFTKKSMRYLLKWSGKSRYDIRREINEFCDLNPKFYAYFADYDWVVLCHLFGHMIDLPVRFPKYCMDLKQMMEERGLMPEWREIFCPDPANEHNALADARWNKVLYATIMNSRP